ncbi:ABC transporter ATP-binding protein [Propionibacteriaceae bacterium G1746]|uniref:ABC transporter ATP-binding protein n=1 Tax=Aestuariimicrobium sp. G57 TaxID=3418485 RepID=UPI003C1ACC97
MSTVEVRRLSTGYGSTVVLHDIDLVVRSGAITAVLGDSGSGKSTLLKVIAGFLRPLAGSVLVDGTVVADQRTFVAPERRGVGYVRQDGGLFPHLSVFGNIAFGLPFPRRRHRDKVMNLLELVGLPTDYADRRPDQLSGGQQQRVALARALALEPSVVLLDEPFSALDTALRASTREATARALRQTGATALLVTHDQSEALSFADEVAVLRGGRFRQVAAPRTVYAQPVDAHVAGFLGDANLLPGIAHHGQVDCLLGTLTTVGFSPNGRCRVLVRPEQLQVTAPGAGDVDAVVQGYEYYGHDAVISLRVAGAEDDQVIKARVVGQDAAHPGRVVGLAVNSPVWVFDAYEAL